MHQARGPAAFDCIGLATYVAQDLGLPYEDYTSYEPEPDPEQFLELLSRSCDQVGTRWRDVRVGYLLVMWFRKRHGEKVPQHLAIATDKGLIHTYRVRHPQHQGQVHESTRERWVNKLHSVWRYKAWQQ